MHKLKTTHFTKLNLLSGVQRQQLTEKITSCGHPTMESKILYIHPAAATVYLFTECMVWEQVNPVNVM